MALNDIYVLKMFQEEFSQALLNQFFYQQTSPDGTVGGAQSLFNAFDGNILTQWEAVVISQLSIPNVEVFAVLTPSDYFDATPFNNVGLRTAADSVALPTWVAFEFTSNRNGAGTRRSHKRFAGLEESDVDNNVLSSSFLGFSALAALQVAMGVTISDTEVIPTSFSPVQVKAGWQIGFLLTKNFDINTWQTARLSSQVSRKP